MYNRIPFNRSQFSRYTSSGHSNNFYASLLAAGHVAAELHVHHAMTARLVGTGQAASHIIRQQAMRADLEGQTSALLHIRRIRFLVGALVGESVLIGTGLQSRSTDVLELHGLGLHAGDELAIDTEHMTVFINGNNAVDKLTDLSMFFKLEDGCQIDFEGDGFVDLSIVWKDRWY